MLLCGVRAGELLTLRVQDVRFGAIPSITVVRRPPDPDDPRRPRPRVKKLGRTIPIDAPFASVMNRYIMEFREELVRRAKVDFPYLIVTDDGAPLSRPRLNAIFLEIRAKYPKELPEDLTPHSLRHTFSTELECDLAAAGMEEDRRARALALMRGDSSSDSQDPYIVREIQERAHRALGAYQRKVLRNPTSDEEGETS
jgi:integrase